jgi:hypothetical protein
MLSYHQILFGRLSAVALEDGLVGLATTVNLFADDIEDEEANASNRD